jgi:hypothetical protein
LSGNRRAYQEEIKKKIIGNIGETVGVFNKSFKGADKFRSILKEKREKEIYFWQKSQVASLCKGL